MCRKITLKHACGPRMTIYQFCSLDTNIHDSVLPLERHSPFQVTYTRDELCWICQRPAKVIDIFVPANMNSARGPVIQPPGRIHVDVLAVLPLFCGFSAAILLAWIAFTLGIVELDT
jgi:hypothetical protein